MSGWEGVERDGLFTAFSNTESKGQQMRLVLVRLKENEVVLLPQMSLLEDTEDAEPGQMLGREIYCGLLNR